MSNPYRSKSAKHRPTSSRSAASRVDERKAMLDEKKKELRQKLADRRSRMKAQRRNKFADKRDESLFDGGGDFNPQRYDHDSRIRNAANPNRRMFDKHGNINAVDKKDALTQIYHLLGNITSKNADKLSFSRVRGDEPQMTKEARRDILAAAIKDPSGQGFHIVGQELALPIKAILDYEGFSRKVYRVRKLAQAELFRIPVDIRSTAFTVGQDGQTPEAHIKTKWITPSEFKVTSFPTIDIMDIYHMNFDVLDRAQDTARQEIELREDKAGIALIDRASQADNIVTTFASLNVGAFEAVRYQVERHRLMVENFLISRAELSDIITTMSGFVDPVTERELLLAGYIGNLLNAQILTAAGTGVQEVIPAGTFYATTGADYMGEMGVRVELFSEPYNKYSHQETVKGWAFCEIIGFGIPNPRACAKGKK